MEKKPQGYKKYYRLLTIAGSDSSGGAGIQADLKTFSAFRCYGMSAITAVTAQNTVGVSAIHPIPVSCIREQIQAIKTDIGVDAVKVGMLHSKEVVCAVAEELSTLKAPYLVVDPVMVSTSGARLIEENAIDALKQLLLPLATVITPNVKEAEVLLDCEIKNQQSLVQAAKKLCQFGNQAVYLKAGHLKDAQNADCLYDSATKQYTHLTFERIHTQNTHGTGCTLSAALAASLAQKHNLKLAAQRAQRYLITALQSGTKYHLGHGFGPVNHGVSTRSAWFKLGSHL